MLIRTKTIDKIDYNSSNNKITFTQFIINPATNEFISETVDSTPETYKRISNDVRSGQEWIDTDIRKAEK